MVWSVFRKRLYESFDLIERYERSISHFSCFDLAFLQKLVERRSATSQNFYRLADGDQTLRRTIIFAVHYSSPRANLVLAVAKRL